jgi:uncharacterized protein (TIGR03437 family)
MRFFFAAFPVLLLGLAGTALGEAAPAVLPAVTGCARTSGSALVVSGTGFLPDVTVQWNSSPLAVTSAGSTAVTASLPPDAGAADDATVSVRSGGIVANCVSVAAGSPPQLLSVTPGRIDAGGDAVTLSVQGSGFLPGATIVWSGAPLPTTVLDSGHLTVVVPARLKDASGAFTLTAVNPDETVSNSLTIAVQPVLVSVQPNSAPTGQSPVTIVADGSGFVPSCVLIFDRPGGRLTLATTYAGPSTLTAIVPASVMALSVQAAVLVLDTAAGAFSRSLPFTIGQPPVLTSLSPDSAVAGGTGFTMLAGGTGFLPGAAVKWNSALLPTAFVSDTQLTAGVSPALIASPGTASVGVTVPGGISNNRTFSIAPPSKAAVVASVVNAASSLPSIAPGSLISLYGANLASSSGAPASLPAPTSLGGASVSINGQLAPLLYASPAQINAQVPFEIPLGKAMIVVQTEGGDSAPVSFDITGTAPGIVTGPGGNHALAQNLTDGSWNSPENPARPGQYVALYVTGQGLVDYPVATGAPAPASPLSRPLATAAATLGGVPTEIQSLGLLPGAVGIAQLTLLVPAIPSGEQSVSLTIGDVAANTTTISVSQD